MSLLLAIYLFLAFISYLYTWKTDQDKVLHFSWELFLQPDLLVENWLGRFGAIISNLCFYWGIGLPSFVVVYILWKAALLLFTERSFLHLLHPMEYALMIVLYFSPLLDMIFANSLFPWGGAFGSYISEWLIQFVGMIGSSLMFLFLGAAFMIWHFHHLSGVRNFSLHWPAIPWKTIFSRSEQKGDETEDEIFDEMIIDIGHRKNTPDVMAPHTLDFDIPKSPRSGLLETGNAQELEIPEPTFRQEIKAEPDESLVTSPKIEIQSESSSRETPELTIETENQNHLEPYDPTAVLPRYERPKLTLLNDYYDHNIQINREELEQNKDQIIRTLLHYKIEIIKIRATIGPTVTLYEIVPAPGVRISKIKNLEDDIALNLAALGIRIIAPIPGKGTIGIEVPNKDKQTVGLKELLNAEKFKHAKMDLPIALGKTIANEVFIADLAKMPHLLIAGATGQGKSVGINAILMSLIFKKHPSQVKLVLIDPKKVELFPYRKLDRHFLAFLPNQDDPIITETKQVVYTLNSLCIEMDIRYDLLKKAHARNITEYNKKFIGRKLVPTEGHRFLPFIVLVIDEFADLIMIAGKEVELPIARLAQLARAVGIHLVIATQRPSVNIITGVIKANFPARIAFRVTAKVDSRTILDAGGADQLIGRGDLLLTVGGDMIRLQCAFVDTPELEQVIASIDAQDGFPEPFFLPEYHDEDSEIPGSGGIRFSDLDEMFEDAARLIIQNQHGSTSMIQRRLKLGYNRAGRIMDQLEAFGIVGPNEGSKAREVLFFSEMELDKHLEQIRLQN